MQRSKDLAIFNSVTSSIELIFNETIQIVAIGLLNDI